MLRKYVWQAVSDAALTDFVGTAKLVSTSPATVVVIEYTEGKEGIVESLDEYMGQLGFVTVEFSWWESLWLPR